MKPEGTLWLASGIMAAFSIACVFAYLVAVPVGLYMLYRIPTQCPMEVER